MFTYLKKKPRSVLGIDITTTSIKILELASWHNQYSVEGYGCIPFTLSSNNITAMANSIKGLLSNANLLSRQAVLAVPDSCTISKIIHISAHVPERDIEEWVLMEAEKYLPYSLDDINLDFNILGPSAQDSQRLDILVVASRAENVHLRVETIRRAGLDVQIVDVESYAYERTARLWTDDCHEKQTAIFDIELLHIRFFVFNGKNIIFSHEDILADMHSLPLFCEFLLQKIKRALQLFSSTIHHGSIGQIVLAGSMARLDRLEQFLQEHLGIPTHIANPFIGMRFSKNVSRDLVEKDAPMLMVACGLALRR